MKRAAFLLLFLLLGAPAAFAGKFTLAVLPDTQHEVESSPPMFQSQMTWLAKHKPAFPIVLHVGDVIECDTPDHAMWKTASAGFKLLDDAGVPYAMAVGNHDNDWVPGVGDKRAWLRKTDRFNAFFPPGRFTAQRGRFEEGKSDNAWHLFQEADSQWLVLALELWPRREVVDWAKKVIGEHPRHNVIVITHSHLLSSGEIQAWGAYGDLSPLQVFRELYAQYPNVLLVLSGHVGLSARRADKGAHGNTVYQILQDYQNEDHGGGYIRLLEIDTAAGTISARMYSPYYDVTRDDDSRFIFTGVKFLISAER